jgi:glycosyltransferase involved in cell wall biosynthesis
MAPSLERKIRVGVVIPYYYPIFGGAENQCRALLRELAINGAIEFPFLLTRRKDSGLVPEEMVDGVRVIRLGPAGVSRWAHYGFCLGLLWRLLRLGRSADLLHCHATGWTGFCVTMAGRLLGLPVLLKLSSNGELAVGTRNLGGGEGKVVGSLRRAVARIICRHAAVVALNREGLRELMETDCRRPYCLPNGVDSRRFQPISAGERLDLRRRLGLPEEAVILLFTGRFVFSKGIDLLVTAFGQLAAERGEENVILCLAGSGVGQAEAVGVPNEPGIRAFSPLEDVSPLLQAADVFVFPSRREGLPNAVLEALAVGLPCVLSDIEPHLELAMANPQSAIAFFPSGDAAALAAALVEACHEVRERRPAAVVAVSALAPGYRLEDVTSRYLDLYRELFDARS